jgi:hypothetical protein
MADHWFIIDLMLSWDALDPFRFKPAGVVTTAFLDLARADLRTAGQYLCGLPYGRNSDPNDPLIAASRIDLTNFLACFETPVQMIGM